jgi:PAS domain S-box-containing protein
VLHHPGKTITDQYRAQHKDGSYRWIESMTTNLLADPDAQAIVVSYRDVTERKGTEAFLRFHADILKNVRDGIIVTDLKAKIVYWNEGATSVYGYAAEEMLGRTPRILYPSEESYQQYLKQLIEQNVNTGVHEHVRKDGRRVWVDLKVTKMLQASGQVIGYIGIAKDITERRQVEQALRDSEKKFRTVAESTPASVIIYQGTTFRYVNAATEKITGYNHEELLRMNFWHFFHPDVREAAKQRGLARQRGESLPSQYETRIITKSGEERLFYIAAATLTDFEGKPAVLAIGLDITEHKRAEEKLRQSEAQYRLLFENNPQPMWLYDRETLAFIAVNEAAVQHYGYSREEFLAMTIKDIRPESQVAALLAALSPTSSISVRNGQWKHRKRDGTIIDVEIAAHSLRFGERNARLVRVNDVTARKQVEAELRISRQGLQSLAARLHDLLEEERGVIAREIHDQLGQLLTGLKMDLAWMASHLVPSQQILKKKTRSMARLIDRTIESVRRISTGLRPGVLDDLGLEAAIEWQAQEFQDRTGIKTRFTSALKDAYLDGNLSTAAFRILQEALTNVARHAGATKVTVDLRELDGELTLMVEDNGRGIKSCEITDKKSLGLLGMRERAHLLGGEIEIRGLEGKGTTVAMRIPLAH